jgi:hypothetical protein
MKHKLLTLASAAALLAACSDSSVSDANDEIKEKATVTIFAYDVLTRLPLENVSVYYRTTDKTKKTDSTGTIVWRDVDIGQSYFDLQLDGYAMKRHDVVVTDNVANDVARVNDNTEKVEMYELGVDVKGKFYYRDPETKDWKPAANATVYIDYPDSSEIYPNEVYTKTNEDGSYEFKNLAANVGFEVKSERFTVDSTVYEVTTIGSTAQRKGVLKEMDPMVAEVASLEPRLLSSNLSSVGVKDDLKLTFSEVLEKDSITTKHINVKRITDDTTDPVTTVDVAVTLSLSEDGQTVTVKSNSGAWAEGKSYLINFDVWSKLAKELVDSVKIDGVEYKYYRKFIAGAPGVPGQVKNLMIKLDDDDEEIVSYEYSGKYTLESEEAGKSDLAYNEKITIKWDAIEKNVDQYNVYVKGDNEADADYTLAGSVKVGSVPEDTVFEIDLAKVLNQGNFLSYPKSKKQSSVIDVIVLAENSVGEALAKDAKALSIKVFDKASADVKEKQSNEYVEEAEVLLSAVFDCTSESDAACAALTKGNTLSGTHFRANLIIKSTSDTKYDGTYPDGYALYMNTDEGWKKIKEQDGAANYTFALDYTDEASPFKKAAMKYDTDKSFKPQFLVVPYFAGKTLVAPGYCSDDTFTDKATCEAAFETWTDAVYSIDFMISQTDIKSKYGTIAAADDVMNLVKKWQE